MIQVTVPTTWWWPNNPCIRCAMFSMFSRTNFSLNCWLLCYALDKQSPSPWELILILSPPNPIREN